MSSSAPAAASSPAPSVLPADGASCVLMGLAGGAPSAESVDYVECKRQFQLHGMLTEQRHANTMRMSQTIGLNCAQGLSQILSVDDDITRKLATILAAPEQLSNVRAMESAFLRAMREKRRIYVYGCGATGRLAKLVESTFWRPFWRRLLSPASSASSTAALESVAAKIRKHASPSIESDCIGEMTGADRALISSLEGFEDLQLIGALQLQDRGISRGDVVVAVTEGGETSSVIGTIRAALAQWREPAVAEGASAASSSAASAAAAATDAEIRSHLFFVYNNPDDLLLPFLRSASVLTEAAITKINLTTGPQAITGSTRMQATSSETFVIVTALQAAMDTFLRGDCGLTSEEMQAIGFGAAPSSLESKLGEYPSILAAVNGSVGALARFTEFETELYQHGGFSTYFASPTGLMTVFIDNTERSPTFRLFALDTVDAPARKCWLQVWTEADTAEEAWTAFLGRPFRGMEDALYRAPFEAQIADPYLRATAMRSLPNAGTAQAALYDFSFSAQNRARRGGIAPGDLGVLVLVGANEVAELSRVGSRMHQYAQMFVGSSAPAPAERAQGPPTRLAVLVAMAAENAQDTAAAAQARVESLLEAQGLPLSRIAVCVLLLPALSAGSADPLALRAQMALKIALNAHSTGVMARLGKVLGNSMINVSPSNLKLIGRATHWILAFVNETAERCGLGKTVSYALANAVLYDSIDVIRAEQQQQSKQSDSSAAGTGASAAQAQSSAEVALCIVRMLRSLSEGRAASPDECLKILADKGLGTFLDQFEKKHAAKKN